MARGDMKMTKISVNLETEILNRKEFEATPMTIDFADVTDTADNGEKIVKAGMPIDKDGKPVKTTPWTGAVGILLHDAYESRPQQQDKPYRKEQVVRHLVTFYQSSSFQVLASYCRIFLHW